MLSKEEKGWLKQLRQAVELRIKNGQRLTDKEFNRIWEMIKNGEKI